MEISGTDHIANKGGVGPSWQLLAEGGSCTYVCTCIYAVRVCVGVGIVCVWGGWGVTRPSYL